MNIKSLTLKNKLVDETTGEFYFDLTAPSFIYDADLGIKTIHYVLQDQVGRIDKISEIYFGSTEFIDAICVVNNIFNPFSVNEGDVLVIPNLKRPDLVYKKPSTITRPNFVQEQFVDTGRQSQKDQSRIQRLLKKAKEKKSGVSTPLPPNMLQPGQDAKVFENGKIKLGTNLNSKSTFINSDNSSNQ
jgi:hypothetical protein